MQGYCMRTLTWSFSELKGQLEISAVYCHVILIRTASAAAVYRELKDVTECPICVTKFTDPRVLPGVHTYCFECIKTMCKNKRNGSKAACPLCIKEFVIPEGGVEKLPRNFLLTKHAEYQRLVDRRSPGTVFRPIVAWWKRDSGLDFFLHSIVCRRGLIQ